MTSLLSFFVFGLLSLGLLAPCCAMAEQAVGNCWDADRAKTWATSEDVNVVFGAALHNLVGDCGFSKDGVIAERALTRLFYLAMAQGDRRMAYFGSAGNAACFVAGPCARNGIEAVAWLTVALSVDPGEAERAQTRQMLDRQEAQLTSGGLERAQARARSILAQAATPSETPHETAPSSEEPRKATVTYGTAFFVSSKGHAVTNHHVVAGCGTIRLGGAPAVVVAIDANADLAVLRTTPGGAVAATLREGAMRAGDPVVVVGFPLPHVLAPSEPNVTTGVVSALAGPENDRRVLQITAPVQPGNSGGPVLDSSGHVAGVVVATLSTVQMANATGAIPQNLNFAVKAPSVRALLESYDVPFHLAQSAERLDVSDVAARARRFIVQTECVQ